MEVVKRERRIERSENPPGVNLRKEYFRLAYIVPWHTFSIGDFCRRGEDPEEEMIRRGLWDRAIIKERVWYMAREAARVISLNEQAIVRHNGKQRIVGFYIHVPDDTKHDGRRYAFLNFGSMFAAKHFIDFMINNRKFKWVKTNTIEIEDGTTIRSEAPEDLQDVIEYEYKGDERTWQMPEPSHSNHGVLRDGSNRVKRRIDGEVVPEPKKGNTERKAAKREKIKSEKPADTGDTFGPAEIAHELDMEPSDVRGVLRKAMEKPDGGWSWPKSKFESICEIVRKGRKPR